MKPILKKGIDYTVENKLYIFTSKYLEKRGYCCRNVCRNCPFDFSRKSNNSKINQ